MTELVMRMPADGLRGEANSVAINIILHHVMPIAHYLGMQDIRLNFRYRYPYDLILELPSDAVAVAIRLRFPELTPTEPDEVIVPQQSVIRKIFSRFGV